MEEETVQEAQEETQEVEESPAEKAAKALSEALGTEISAEELEKVKNLKKWEAKLRKESMALSEQKKAPPVVEEKSKGEDTPAPEFDDATMRALDAYYEKKLGPALSVQEERFKEDVDDAVETFLAEHSDLGEDATEVLARAQELWTKPTVKNLKAALKSAYVEKRMSDPETLEREIRERVLKELEAKGEEIVEVKPKRSGVSTGRRTADDILDDPTLSMQEKDRLLQDLGY